MAEQNQEEQWRRADDEVRKNLPPAARALRASGLVECVAFDPSGFSLASGSENCVIEVWKLSMVTCFTHGGHRNRIASSNVRPGGDILAS